EHRHVGRRQITMTTAPLQRKIEALHCLIETIEQHESDGPVDRHDGGRLWIGRLLELSNNTVIAGECVGHSPQSLIKRAHIYFKTSQAEILADFLKHNSGSISPSKCLLKFSKHAQGADKAGCSSSCFDNIAGLFEYLMRS